MVREWVALREVASVAGLPAWRVRRILQRVEAESGRRVMRRFTPRGHWFVSRGAVAKLFEHDTAEVLASVLSSLENHDRLIRAMSLRIRALESVGPSANNRTNRTDGAPL